MVQIVGKYEFIESENFHKYLESIGVPADEIKKADELDKGSVIEISEAGGTWTVKSNHQGKEISTSYVLGKPYDEKMLNGDVIKSVTKQEGNKFVTESDVPSGEKVNRISEFTDNGLLIHLVDKKSGVKAIRKYKRI